jgi:hypothetical protein
MRTAAGDLSKKNIPGLADIATRACAAVGGLTRGRFL